MSAEADRRPIGCPVARVFLARVSAALVAGRVARSSPARVDAAVVLSECGACSNRHCGLAHAYHQSRARGGSGRSQDWAARLVALARRSGNSRRKAAPASRRVTRSCGHDTRAALVKRAHLGRGRRTQELAREHFGGTYVRADPSGRRGRPQPAAATGPGVGRPRPTGTGLGWPSADRGNGTRSCARRSQQADPMSPRSGVVRGPGLEVQDRGRGRRGGSASGRAADVPVLRLGHG